MWHNLMVWMDTVTIPVWLVIGVVAFAIALDYATSRHHGGR